MSDVRGNTDLDRAIASLIMQTDVMREAQRRSDQIMDKFDASLDSLSVAVTKLDANVGHLGESLKSHSDHGPRIGSLETRLAVANGPIERWERFESRIFYYAIEAAVIAIAGGAAGAHI